MLPDPYLADLMKAYHFSIVGLHSLPTNKPGDERGTGDHNTRSGSLRTPGGWRQVILKMQRDVVCETCERSFDYTFDCLTGGTVSRGQRAFDTTALASALERQLRRRIRCPHCHALQRSVRRTFIQRERRHSLVGLIALGGTVVGATGLSTGGYVLAGVWGLMTGLGLSVGLVLMLTRWMLMQLLDTAEVHRA